VSTALYEVHTHSVLTGRGGAIEHSHPGGNEPHRHMGTGPACFTIDKDAWLRATGMRGGGRKKFTEEPTGSQLSAIAIPVEERRVKVFVHPSAREVDHVGAGSATLARMVAAFGLVPEFMDGGDGAA
jgi:hypothetical protein